MTQSTAGNLNEQIFLRHSAQQERSTVAPIKLDSTSLMPYTRSCLVYSLTSQLSIHLFTDLFMYLLLGIKDGAGYSEGYKDRWYIVSCWHIIECDKVFTYFGC